MPNFSINEYDFNEDGKNIVASEELGKDWPVVYLIHNEKELYIGETQNIYKRFEQHLNNQDRKKLKKINIIFDEEFNKSAVLDIEQTLIRLCGADNKYLLQNLNGGQSEKHNYYQREKYVNKVDEIWSELNKIGMANKSITELRNTDLFKYSPYNTLTSEQNEVSTSIIYDIIDKVSKGLDATSIICGGAGTGKTIVLINMIFKLVNANKINIDFSDEEDSLNDNMQLFHDLKEFINKLGHELRIGYVVPMTSIRKTLKVVFRNTKNGLKPSMIIGPFDVSKEKYDVVFVDEAHRLSQFKNIPYRKMYRDNAALIGKNAEEVTQLDMIIANSKYRVLVYDKEQTVKGSDITDKQFHDALDNRIYATYNLTTQMRCDGGTLYTKYIDDILCCRQSDFLKMDKYDFKIFNNVDDMINAIKELDKIHGLCRNAAGYSWEWISKGMNSFDEIIRAGKQDIIIGNYKYVWNMTNQEFILSENAINEIGCIHTLQGYDLNYIGLIFGYEIDYYPNTNEIVIDPNKFYDKYVKQGADYDTLKKYIINSYRVIMTRGIKGCYIYACNDNLRNYLSKFIENYND